MAKSCFKWIVLFDDGQEEIMAQEIRDVLDACDDLPNVNETYHFGSEAIGIIRKELDW
jgi:hypothetical protein